MKLSSGAYVSLQNMREDVERVSEQLIASVRDKAKEREGANAGRLLVEDLKQMQKIRAFAQLAGEVVEQQTVYEGGRETAKMARSNGDVAAGTANPSGTVLTLFGNAPTPRQLFSSQQKPLVSKEEPVIKSELPVEEISLPNGLAATKIVPVAQQQSAGVTFEEAFATPQSQSSLQPPKSHRRSTTRDDTLYWRFKDQASYRNRKGGYTVQSLTVSDWLSHGGVDGKDDPTSPREKRKQRDRALSGGETTQTPLSKETKEEALAREEEALFRRAYSSFAPSCDNSKSVVPAETKNMMWWEKVGHKRYDAAFAIDPALLDDAPSDTMDELPGLGEWEPNDEDLEQAIADLDELAQETQTIEPARGKTDVDYVLGEISKLLETLASHQRIRTASLPSSTSASRTPISPAPFLAARVGKPDTPAEDEVATYHALRRELAYLILRLPPYAVAKLDGDQLSELGVRRLISFEGKDIKGTMEEDQVARLAKHNAQATAGSIASLTRPGSTSSQHYSNQRTPAIGQAANTRYGQSTQYNSGRTPAQPQFQRSASNQSSYGTPSSAAPRPASYGQYQRPGVPQMNSQQYYQRPTPTNGSYSGYNQQYGQATPQTQQRAGYSQPLAQYTQSHAAARNAVAYQSNSGSQGQQAQSPFNRTASPIKPATAYQQPVQPRPQSQQPPQQYAQQQQPGSGRTTPANYPSQPHTPVNGFQRPTPQPIAQAPPRAASGTPQPSGPAQVPPPQPQQQQVLANGHT